MLERLFRLRENNTDVRTEIMAGFTTFMTMVYILAVNPDILSAAGMDAKAVLLATAFASFIGTMLMAFLANYPFALAPSMGMNAYFTYTLVLGYGYSWQLALLAIFVESLIFMVMTVTNVREAIFNGIPATLKSAVSAGIGLFIAFIGLQKANIVVNSESTLVTYQNFHTDFHSVGMGALLALLGVLITFFLLIKNVKGGIFFGILFTWILGILCEITGLYRPNPELGMYSVIPTQFISFEFSPLVKTFGQAFKADFGQLNHPAEFVMLIFACMFVDVFNTLGSLIGVSAKAGMLDESGRLPRMKRVLIADTTAAGAGAVLGTSTTTTLIESASGVMEGGRTGLTSAVAGILFLMSVIFSPLFLMIPSFATAPAMIVVGFHMIASVSGIDWSDMTKAIPAFLCLIMMPLAYSISEGIALGVISWTVLHVLTGKAKDNNVLLYVLTLLFILKYIIF